MARRAVSRARGPAGTAGLAEREVEQGDQPVVGGHLGDRVPGRQGAGGQRRPVAGPGRLAGGGLEAVPGLIDLPGEQEAPAEPHFQVGVQAVPPLAERDRRPPPGRRVLEGQQAVGGFGGGPGGFGGDLVADVRACPARHGGPGRPPAPSRCPAAR